MRIKQCHIKLPLNIFVLVKSLTSMVYQFQLFGDG